MTHGSYETTSIPGVFTFTPQIHGDDRGAFLEWFKADAFAETAGYPFIPEQANMSVSAAGVLRGIHLAEVPPGQAKMVTCPAGRVLDIIVDLRVGSPAYLKHIVVELGGEQRQVVHLPVGVGHGFISLVDDSVVTYLTSTGYDPDAEFGVNVRDAELGIDVEGMFAEHLPGVEPILSAKDAAAPGLEDVAERLPTWDDCVDLETEMKDIWVLSNQEASE
ncbi:dTDP-4-dehydrorhamnose 3,5-epimerase family protein [Corynebacterium ulceribovis]|uniref:dTDP-4-dehydrorhamnose 3,5-epimerase family protein n=1 Tax=Corynebacterium ulceribovis TaxID=487732 RepID=UPI00036FC661|nr:dTDP-4-dehydrorhamnose 3,5-epimerase [Corynebacterium ulceribovis]